MGRVVELLQQPKFWIRLHATLTVVWIMLIIPSVLLWKDSIPYLVFMSAWANIAGSAASWQAAKADRNSPTAEDLHRIDQKITVLLRRAVKAGPK